MIRLRASLPFVALVLTAASARANTITTHDTGGVGQYTSVAYGPDGLALIAYYDVANGDLKVAHCLDAACTASTRNTVDSAGDVGRFASVAIGTNGRGIISYLDVTNARVKVARCADAACTSAPAVTLTNAGPAGDGTDIAVPPDGRPVIAFRDGGNALRMARCTDAVCSDAAAVTVSPTHGKHPTVTIVGDGLPLLAGGTGGQLILAHCSDADCITSTSIVFGAGAGTPDPDGALFILASFDPVLSTTPDGRGALTYATTTTTAIIHSLSVAYLTCNSVVCSSVGQSKTFGMASGPFGSSFESPLPGVAVRANGTPVLAALRPTGGLALTVADCSAPNCFGAAAANLDTPGAGRFASVAVSPAGLALVAYQSEAATGSLKTLYLDTAPIADMTAVSLFAGPNPVGAGQTLLYQAQIQNLGPDVARSVIVRYDLPPGVVLESAQGCAQIAPGTVSCPINDVAPGAAFFTASITMRVPPGLTGPLTGTATVTTLSTDPNPANNAASATVATMPTLRIRSPQVLEGNSGPSTGRFDVDLVDDGSNPPSVVASYTMGGGSATAGADYVPTSGSLTFTPAATTQSVTVSIVGDNLVEGNENFFLQLLAPSFVATDQDEGLIILDDDPFATAQSSLGHGMTIVGDLSGTGPFGPEDRYVVSEPPNASFEVIADAVSGDVQPLDLDLLSFTGSVLATGVQSTIGGSVRLVHTTGDGAPALNNLVRVRSGGCTTCGPDDVYRLRAYETTAYIARFNNTGDQVTVLILQNPSSQTGSATVFYWGADGQQIGFDSVTIPASGVTVRSTAALVPGQSGSITIRHNLPYGVLQGKSVALEPATGFSFDSPLTYRSK